jgi:hypothetical protein
VWTIEAEAVILFDEQRTAISLKRAVPLFVAQIVILFIRIGEQIAEIALFLFSIRFGRSRIDEQRGLFVPHETNKRIEEQRFPPFLHHSAHFNYIKFILLCSKPYKKCVSYSIPLFTKICFHSISMITSVFVVAGRLALPYCAVRCSREQQNRDFE